MFTAEYKTASEMIEQLTTRYMLGDEELMTTKHFDRTYTSPAVIKLTEPKPDLDFSIFGWKESRWEKFCKAYLAPDFLEWAGKLLDLPVTAEWGYTFKTAGHDNGNCVVYISFRNNPIPTFTVYSRASFFVPTAILEMSLANILVDRVAPFFKNRPQIIWMSAQIQFSPIWAFPYLVNYWMPKYWNWEMAQRENLSIRELKRQLNRFNEYKESGTLPPYGRQANMYKRTDQDFPPFIPQNIFIDGEWV